MLYFHNDYNESCHPAVMKKMQENMGKQMGGYGVDTACERAAEMIRCLCKKDDLSVHFLVGGTQTNLTVIAAALRPHQAALGAETAHINVHETGAIEATGHKVIGLPTKDGKITAEQVRCTLDAHFADEAHEHIPQPKMIYISNPVLAEDFRYIMKQHGAMLAKGWLLGLQYEALLENDLYFKIASHADGLADKIRATLSELHYPLLVEGVTNQIFPILPDVLLDKLKENFTFSEQLRVDDTHRAVRFCTSWATSAEAVDALCNELKKLSD